MIILLYKFYNMDEYYLTPEITILNAKAYYNSDNNKIQISSKNWHKYFKDYGWRKLDKIWIKYLNKNSEKRNCNYKWGMRSCGTEGDCLFDAIAEALNTDIYYDDDNTKEFIYDVDFVRKKVSECITDVNFEEIITLYRIGYINGEYSNQWNPYMVESYTDLKKELIKSGENFVGDHIIIQLMISAFKINFIILNNNNDYICYDFDKNRKTVILYYINNEEDFKLLGYFNSKIQTIFNYNDLPHEIKKICKLEETYKNKL